MKQEKTTVILKAKQGDRCLVENYRNGKWEQGKVTFVTAYFFEDGSVSVHYRVMLDRRSTARTRFYPEGGGGISLTVGEEGIEKL